MTTNNRELLNLIRNNPNPSDALAKAIELMETAIEKSSAYADKEEEEKAIRSGIRSTLTSYWKPHYKVANYENDREEMGRILNVLTETGLYGNRYETRRTIQKWLEEEE